MKYSHARHIDKVLKGSQLKYSARAVLQEICRRAEFDRPESTITKPQLMRILGYDVKTIKHALAALRGEGCIVPIAGFEGGKGRATTYRLVALGQGTEEEAEEAGQGARKCPPELFMHWHKHLGMTEAMQLLKRYEAGEELDQDSRNKT